MCLVKDKFVYSSYKILLENDEDYEVNLTILT